MAPVPILMILYKSDAVEIRYSDGSCLELSPCGSAMIHHEAPDKREHHKHGQSRKVQKRTRFVTSEHRQKVVQALDFRNRFAERPYLCDDLLPKDDIMALYARVESIAWPKLPGEANIEVLPDGSRRITSLDEFASLVISPHGHDFTVCYLSRVSEDKCRSKSSLAKHTGSRTSVKCFQSTSEKECFDNIKNELKPNAAVIQPFEITDQSKDAQVKNSPLACEVNQSRFIGDTSKMHELKSQDVIPEDLYKSDDHVPSVILAANHSIPTGERPEAQQFNSQEKEINLAKSTQNNKESSNYCTQTSDIQNNERHFAEQNNKPLDAAIPTEKKPALPFCDASSDSNDISSISRSSTPDGLRATIDSDATLTSESIAQCFHDHNCVREKRNSSPTQYTSSPYDVQDLAHSKNLERFRINMDASLTSSFLGNEKIQNVCEEIECDSNMKELSNSIQKISSLPACDKSSLPTCEEIKFDSIIKEPKKLPNSPKEKSSLPTENDCHGTLPADAHSLKNEGENNFLPNFLHFDNPESPHLIANKIRLVSNFSHDKCAEKGARVLDFEANSKCIHLETESNIVSAEKAILEERCSNIFQVGQDDNAESQHRERYIWTTSHCSRNECPGTWIHPLRLILGENKLTEVSLSQHPSTSRSQGGATTLKACEKTNCTYTTVPSPLPVTCPFNHKGPAHNYLDDAKENSASSLGDFQHGRLKIVISEGVVYRLVDRTEMNIVEIHPGDGSIFVSEGVKGHFFTHYIIVGDQLQQRTYSLKSLPRQKLEGMYSVGKLIEMGNRLLVMNNEWQHRVLKDDVPCWKREVVAVVEPLSSSLLEEHVVEGLGKFTAFTNGRVRIIFEDRTALDMVCNFSKRVKECLQHSQEPVVASLPCANSVSPPVPTVDSIFGANTGRLLLPSGQYVTVDLRKPGQYRNYIQIAQEWAAWVGSSSLERHQFYSQYHSPAYLQQAAEIELKKIFCFNYILEQTMLMQQEQLHSRKSYSTMPTAETPGGKTSYSLPQSQPYNHQETFALPHCDLQPIVTPSQSQLLYTKAKNSCRTHEQKEKCRDASPSNHSPRHHGQDKAGAVTQRDEPAVSPWALRAEYKSNRKVEDIIMGFQSVKQVLLQNSSMINDIEQFLETSRKS